MYNEINTPYLARFFGYLALSIGLFMTVLTSFEFIGLMTAKNIQAVTRDDVHMGMCIEGEVPYTIGCYATKNSSVNSVVISSDGYYMIPFGENYDLYIGFYSGIQQGNIERLYEDTYNYLSGEVATSPKSFYMSGIVLPCVGQMKSYMMEMMTDYSLDEYVTYYLYPIDQDMIFRSLGIIFVVTIIGILCTLEANRQQKRMYLHGISKEQQKEIQKGKIIMFLVVFGITVAVCIYVFF